MLQRALNPFLEFAAEAKRLRAEMMADSIVKPSTVSSRAWRERLDRYPKNDPPRCYRIFLQQTTTAQMTLGISTTDPQDHARLVFTDRQFDAEISKAVQALVEKFYPPKRPLRPLKK